MRHSLRITPLSLVSLLLLCTAAFAALQPDRIIENPAFAETSLPLNRSDGVAALPPLSADADNLLGGEPRVVSRHAGTAMVHSPSITELSDGRLYATWFGGSREGAGDVAIYGAYFNPVDTQWSAAKPVITRDSTEALVDRYIRKLGNPVVMRLEGQRLALFFVSVSLGGWATSQINMAISEDNGANWDFTRRLVTSPFFNLSTLVKGTPYRYTDGSIALPVYHELMGKFGELLRISPQGDVLSKTRLTRRRDAIQPVLLPYNEHDAIALLRDSGDHRPFKAVMTGSSNSGLDWSAPENATFFNPNSALAGIVLDCGRLLSVANDTEDERHRLTLLMSSDRGETWDPILRIEDSSDGGEARRHVPQAEFTQTLKQSMASEGLPIHQQEQFLTSAQQALCDKGQCRFRYDYPYLIKSADGTIHLVYTWNKAYIKHRAFSQEWLTQWI